MNVDGWLLGQGGVLNSYFIRHFSGEYHIYINHTVLDIRSVFLTLIQSILRF